MFYYSHFTGRGKEVLIAILGAEDPFKLAPYEIVERVLKAGVTPVLDSRKTDLWRARGQVYEVRLKERNFLVAISREAQQISVQETRVDAYETLQIRPETKQDLTDGRGHIDPGRLGAAMKKRELPGRPKNPSKRRPR